MEPIAPVEWRELAETVETQASAGLDPGHLERAVTDDAAAEKRRFCFMENDDG